MNDTGCNAEKFSWCHNLAPINVYLYYTAYVIVIGFAYSLVNVTLTTLYSKILGPRRQGVTQGIFQISGGCARLTGPLALSILYTEFGPRMTWKVEMAVLGITIATWILF
uniref:Major facilitator superfamily (MFS) profile domain-containing protein n=1 Tax=Panagrolaimus davidi TaxID=227884 RepID=A0A914RBJ4_9BILA